MSTAAPAGDAGTTDLLDHLTGENSGSGAAQEATPAPTTGNPPSYAAPGEGQPASGAEGGKGTKSPDPAGNGSKPSFDEAAAKALGLTGAGEDKAEFYQKKYAESSKEAKSLAKFKGDAVAALAKAGIELASNAEGELGFVANKDFVATKHGDIAKQIVEGLTRAEKDKFLDDTDGAISTVVEKALKLAVSQPVPDMRSEDIQINDLEAKFVRDKLVSAKNPNGTDVLPEYDQLERWIDMRINDPSTPDSFRTFMGSSPEAYEFALRMVYGHTANTLAPFMNNGSNGRKKSAATDISLTSEQTAAGSDSPSGDVDAQKQAQDDVINAPRTRFGSG